MMEFAVMGLAIADRFLLKRNTVKILHANQMDDAEVIRFVLGYQSKRAITSGTVTYSLRSKKRPKAIITRTRKLDFSHAGENSEFLTFDRKLLELEAGKKPQGEWVLDIKIERSCSLVNPLYKIFPTVTHHQEEFYIE
ncbi:hypothetical protein ACUNB4_004240 [Vibrio alginolyticus]